MFAAGDEPGEYVDMKEAIDLTAEAGGHSTDFNMLIVEH